MGGGEETMRRCPFLRMGVSLCGGHFDEYNGVTTLVSMYDHIELISRIIVSLLRILQGLSSLYLVGFLTCFYTSGKMSTYEPSIGV